MIPQVFKTIKNYPADVEQTINESTKIDFPGTKPDKSTFKKGGVGADKDEWKDDTSKDEYEHELEKWRKRSDVYNANIHNTAAVVYDSFCTGAMRSDWTQS